MRHTECGAAARTAQRAGAFRRGARALVAEPGASSERPASSREHPPQHRSRPHVTTTLYAGCEPGATPS